MPAIVTETPRHSLTVNSSDYQLTLNGGPITLPASTYGYLNPIAFGADPTGATDSAPAIQSAITAAIARGTGVEITSGTYLLETYAVSTIHLTLFETNSISANSRCDVVGNGRVILTTAQAGSTILRLQGSSRNAQIRNIHFRNTAVGTTSLSYGINSVSGGTGIINPLIADNLFEGFAVSVGLSGVEGARITRNRFLAPNGRDSGTATNTAPNVFIRCDSSVSGGAVKNTIVTDNFFDGYSGTNGIATDAPLTRATMDGSIWGDTNGLIFTNNTIQNFGFEGIQCTREFDDGSSENPIIISDNSINCAVPIGAYNFPTTEPAGRSSMWPIWCASSYAIISGNNIQEAVSPLTVVNPPSSANSRSTLVTGNIINTSSTIEPSRCIDVFTVPPDQTSNVAIRNNHIYYNYESEHTESEYLIGVIRCDDSLVEGNTIHFTGFTTDSGAEYVKSIFRMFNCDNVNIFNNHANDGDSFLDDNDGTETRIKLYGNTFKRSVNVFSGNTPEGYSFVTGEQNGEHVIDVTGGVVTPDAGNGLRQRMVITENITSFNEPTNLDDGQELIVLVQQGDPARSFVFNANFALLGVTNSSISNIPAGGYGQIRITRFDSKYLVNVISSVK